MRLVEAVIAGMRARAIEQWDDVYPAREHFAGDVSSDALHICTIGGDDMAAVFALDDRDGAPEWTHANWTIRDGRIAVVHRLMVHPLHQGHGLARSLMEYAERLAARRGYAAIHLDAFSQNPQALNLYRRLGYRDVGTVTLRKGVFHCFEKHLPSTPDSARYSGA